MRDVNSGYIVRYTHANVASFFFIFVYAQWINFYNKFYSQVTSVYLVMEQLKIISKVY